MKLEIPIIYYELLYSTYYLKKKKKKLENPFAPRQFSSEDQGAGGAPESCAKGREGLTCQACPLGQLLGSKDKAF